MAQGGKRAGAGRPRGSEDRAESARQWATKVWTDSKCDAKLKRILASQRPGLMDQQVRILLKLLEYMHGKPVQPISGAGESDPVVVKIISNIERPKR